MLKIKIILLGLFLGLFVHSSLTYAQSWVEYKSDNFLMYTDAKEKDARELLVQFEKFHTVTTQLLTLSNTEVISPIKIVYFSSSKTFKKFRRHKNVLGYFLSRWSGSYMVIGPDRRFASSEFVLYHEYVHFLLRAYSQLSYPTWYDEGFAEFMAATTIKDESVVIGKVHKMRRFSIIRNGALPLKKLLNPPPRHKWSDKFTSRFYSSAWLFMHFLQMGHYVGFDNYSAQRVKYLQLLVNGEESITALEKSFELPLAKINTLFRRYANKKRIVGGVTIPLEKRKYAIKSMPITKADMAFKLAMLSKNTGRDDQARDYLMESLEANPNHAASLSALAVHLGHDENFTEAFEVLGKALSVGPVDPFVHINSQHVYYDYLDILMEKDDSESVESRQWAMDKIKGHYENSVVLARHIPESYLYYARAKKRLGKRVESLKLLYKAYALAPWMYSVNVEIINTLADSSRPDLAVPILKKVIAWGHNDNQQLVKLLQDIESKIALKSSKDKPSSNSAE